MSKRYYSLLVDRRDGVVVRVSASQSVDLMFIALVESYQKTFLKMVSKAFLLGAQHIEEIVENKPASLFVVTLGKALNGTLPSLCGRQVDQTPRKWPLPSECGRPVENIAI